MKRIHVLTGLLIIIGISSQLFVNQSIAQKPTTPVLSAYPKTGDFYAVQVGGTGTLQFTIKNIGISILKIKEVKIEGDRFTLNDTTHYPFEVVADTGIAFPVGNGGKALRFSVDFKPATSGIHTGKIIITYGLYTDEIYEIPLTGEGMSCSEAAIAVKGENWAPKQDTWFKYTADKFSIVEINSCHPHQQPVKPDFWDSFLYVYSDCQGTYTSGGSEEMGAACSYNPLAVYQRMVMTAGETFYIFWPRGYSSHSNEGFYFTIKVTYPIDGDVCENAIPLTLPVVNYFGNTRGVNDDYNISPCMPLTKYLDGNDIVYSITLAEDGYLTGSIVGSYAAMHVLDVCPKTELTKDHCKGFAGGVNGGQFRNKIKSGNYFVIISNWTPPQSVDFLINLSWEGLSAVENGELTNNLAVWPNPVQDQLTVDFTGAAATDLVIELVNIVGQTVYRKQAADIITFRDEIDTGRLAGGVYYLKAVYGKEIKVKKVVVE